MTGPKKNPRSGDEKSGLANTSLGSSRRPAGSTLQDGGDPTADRHSDPAPAPSTKSPNQQMPKR
jgi:hypothetical protein